MRGIRTTAVIVLGSSLAIGWPDASAQPAPAPTAQTESRPDAAIARALLANPTTAPYRFSIVTSPGRVTLRGRVGSKTVHDAAVQTVIPFGLAISDELVIDTNEAYRVASVVSSPPPHAALVSSYTYPPPLFGRFDDPFVGLEPPLITYPGWWNAVKEGRLAQAVQVATERSAETPLPPTGAIEMTIDPLGVALIRGVVPTEADRIDIGQRLAQSPGVSRVINRLIVGPMGDDPAANARPAQRTFDDVPPPPPTPAVAPHRLEPATAPIVPETSPTPAPAPAPTVSPSPVKASEGLLARLDRAVRGRAELAGQKLTFTTRDGVVTLSGSVNGALEAMIAFRAVQQTPGVREVIDSLRFVVPDGSAPNPLLKGRVEDVEAYLEAQIRRQVGDAAHVDRVRLTGEHLQIRGTLDRLDDRTRVEAILRSMPILRGFTLLPEFRATGG